MNNFAPIFNSSVCFGYPDVTANSRCDLGLMVGIGASTGGGVALPYRMTTAGIDTRIFPDGIHVRRSQTTRDHDGETT